MILKRVKVIEGCLLSVFMLIYARPAVAQNFSLNAGLGIEYFQIPSLSQYMNYTLPGGITPGVYTTAGQFILGAKYFLSNFWAAGLEYGYITKSNSGTYAQINFAYSLPSITLERVMPGDGYYVTFGGCVGYHFASVQKTDLLYSGQTTYTAKGIGIKISAGIDTKLSENFYARLNADARAEFLGNFKSSDGTEMTYTSSSGLQQVNGYLSGVGVSFQLVYYF
jgi:hypothetical protein